MSVLKRKFKATAAVTLLIIAVVVLFIGCTHTGVGEYTLLLKEQDTDKVYRTFKIKNEEVFSVEFIHSVNKSPVCDYFQVKDGEIYALKTKYSAFGAGVQTELEEGQSLSYDEFGNMIVSGFNLKFDSVKYIVGTVSDHILTINQEEISLRELCGKNAHVAFFIE